MDVENFITFISGMIDAARAEVYKAGTEEEFFHWQGIKAGLKSAKFLFLHGRPPENLKIDPVDKSKLN